jgi:uncharacterized damage-inducible protein DinB
MREHFRTFAAYNKWANSKLYDAAEGLSEDDLNRNLNAFFGSVMGTLNHILVADQIWMRRIDNQGSQPESLDTVLYENFSELRQNRHIADERLVQLLETISEQEIRQDLTYTDMSGNPRQDPFREVLAHMFNHQTHHRGQCHHLFSQLGKTPPSLDLIYFAREQR